MLAKQGKNVAVIERKYIVGVCPNIGCLQSKNIIQSAKVASYFRRSEEFGIAKDNFKIARLASFFCSRFQQETDKNPGNEKSLGGRSAGRNRSSFGRSSHYPW
jgi:pyruvate/2-oxoglutarate dehydrogenase complex dihydrolipoamide dehydrogenase (E3) component